MSNPYSENYSSAGTTQLSAKIPEELKKKFKAACDDRGETMTDALTRLIMEDVEDVGGGEQLPSDSTLANGLRALRSLGRRIDTEVAEAVVAQRTQVTQSAVRSVVFDPLEDQGWIRYDWGQITVVDAEEQAEPEPTPEPQQDPGARLEQLSEAEVAE